MKQCKVCGEWKPPTEFYRHSAGSDTLRSDCKVCHLAKNRLRRDPVANVSASKAWRAANAERYRANNARHYRAHIDDERTYRKEHRERYRALDHASVARRRGNGGVFTADEWTALCERYGNICVACGASGPLQVDHIVPTSKGGPNTIDNIQPLCGRCNKSKSDKTIDYRPDRREVVRQ